MANSHNPLDEVMNLVHYSSFDSWVKNFALNLEYIWKEDSAKNISDKRLDEFSKKPSIVIGRGPSLEKHQHLKLLLNSDFDGNILCTDGALKSVLASGVTPDIFPNYYSISVEPYERIKKFYDNDMVQKFGYKINVFFPVIASPEVVNCARQSGCKIFWYHSLFDYNEGPKSFNQISANMIRAKNNKKGLPAIQTGGNAGTTAWFIGWRILKSSTVCLIGINHGWDENDDIEKILSHGFEDASFDIRKNQIDRNSIKKIYNHDFGTICYVDPIFNFYSTTLKEFISRSPPWLTTINATEGGSIFGERIQCKTFRNFLVDYKYTVNED